MLSDARGLYPRLSARENIVYYGRLHGMGAEAEAFINYMVVPHFEIGIGARYWGLFTQSGTVDFGPTFTPDFALTRMSTQRYGLLLQAKATF